MTRHDPAVEAGPSEAGTSDDSTLAATPAEVERGAWLRLHGDAEAMAADLYERLGPAACAALAVWLLDLVGQVAK